MGSRRGPGRAWGSRSGLVADSEDEGPVWTPGPASRSYLLSVRPETRWAGRGVWGRMGAEGPKQGVLGLGDLGSWDLEEPAAGLGCPRPYWGIWSLEWGWGLGPGARLPPFNPQGMCQASGPTGLKKGVWPEFGVL